MASPSIYCFLAFGLLLWTAAAAVNVDLQIDRSGYVELPKNGSGGVLALVIPTNHSFTFVAVRPKDEPKCLTDNWDDNDVQLSYPPNECSFKFAWANGGFDLYDSTTENDTFPTSTDVKVTADSYGTVFATGPDGVAKMVSHCIPINPDGKEGKFNLTLTFAPQKTLCTLALRFPSSYEPANGYPVVNAGSLAWWLWVLIVMGILLLIAVLAVGGFFVFQKVKGGH